MSIDGVCECELSLDGCKLDLEKKISDEEELFKQPPPKEDCPICFQQLPLLKTGYRYNSCCGKVICSGCCYAPVYDDQGNEVDNQKCPFCRTPHPYTDEEMIERTAKRVENDRPYHLWGRGEKGRGYPSFFKGYRHHESKNLYQYIILRGDRFNSVQIFTLVY